MATSYEPWKAPSASNLNFLDQASTVNPGEGSAPPFRGVAPSTELDVHGSFDSPEDTAQTSPATITMACPVSMANWDATIENIQKHRQKIVMVRSMPTEKRVVIEEAYRAERAYASATSPDAYSTDKGVGNSSSSKTTISCQAIALTGSRTGGDTLLVSLMPMASNSSNRLYARKKEVSPGKFVFPNVGVLMSHIAEKSAGIIHITLAVEHAVEIKLKRKNVYSESEAITRSGFPSLSTIFKKESSITGHVTAAEPLLFKWFAD